MGGPNVLRAVLVMAIGVGCGAVHPPPPQLPELVGPRPVVESPTTAAFRERTALLRATLARSRIELETTAGEIDTCQSPSANDTCVRCEVATGMDGIDPDLIDRVAIAIAMYPPAMLGGSALEHVVLCRRLRSENPTRFDPAGLADPEHRRLMISVEAFVDKDPGDYLIEQIVHHELFHLFDARPIGMDPAWDELKPPGFEYRDPAILVGPRPAGFVNRYATTNEREDRASLYEHLMSHGAQLCEIAKADPIVAAKTTLIWRRVAAVAGDVFLRRQAPCVDWVEIGPRPPKPAFRMR